MKCSFGCNNFALYKLKNGKMCCEKYFTKCPSIKKKNSQNQLGNKASNITKLKQSISQKNRWTPELKKEYSNRMKKKYSDFKERDKQREFMLKLWESEDFKNKNKQGQNNYFNKHSKNTIKDIQTNFRVFSKVEQLRYKPDTFKIQVKCKNCNCWFTPTSQQIYERINQLEHPLGNDGCYLYCSSHCKNICPLYNLKSDPIKNSFKIYTKSEYQQFREHVLERDNYKCQYCGEKAEHVHHERPQKLEPFFALDPDYAWSVCKKCHYEKGHQDECSTGNLAQKTCI